MSLEIENKMKELKRKFTAFSDYLENGIEFVRKYFPDQEEFVLSNKDNDPDTVLEKIHQEMVSTTQS